MMSGKGLIVGIVGAGCIGAAGIGGYLAAGKQSALAPAAVQTAVAPPAAHSIEVQKPHEPEVRATPAPRRPAAPRPLAKTPQRPPKSDTARVSTREPAPASTPVTAEATSPVRTATEEATRETGAPSGAPPAPVTNSDPQVTEIVARPAFEDVTLAENSVIGIRLETPISSDTAKVEDRLSARVTRDVIADGRVVVPADSTVEGLVVSAERGGRFRERARLGIQFTAIVLADETRVPIQTEAILRTGEAPGGEATAKIGAGAVIGGILGGVIGGKKGAAIGGTAGAAGGTAAVMASGPNHVMLVSGTALTVRLTEPATFRIPAEP
jgi:hypothetical protein